MGKLLFPIERYIILSVVSHQHTLIKLIVTIAIDTSSSSNSELKSNYNHWRKSFIRTSTSNKVSIWRFRCFEILSKLSTKSFNLSSLKNIANCRSRSWVASTPSRYPQEPPFPAPCARSVGGCGGTSPRSRAPGAAGLQVALERPWGSSYQNLMEIYNTNFSNKRSGWIISTW